MVSKGNQVNGLGNEVHDGLTSLCFRSSSVTPFVSGIIRQTNKSWRTIINANAAKMDEMPTLLINNGIRDGMMAASTQCT